MPGGGSASAEGLKRAS